MAQDLCKNGTARRKRRRLVPILLATALAALPFFSVRAEAMPAGVTQLAETLGGIHHLRTLCGTNEGQLWRNKMIEMMGAVRPSETERQALIKHFNDAYYRYRNAYPNCTPTAATQCDKLMQNGHRLAEELAASGLGR
ncbi:MAG: TIGR02301 family protein [Alphaproteobacteria bacterium HGW-Alphaproteobacteria-3]|nr:MAG: TIGR02301 family protein [Alphaproteobacteria bacterium HGW-Alphaproteobacteria-3]